MVALLLMILGLIGGFGLCFWLIREGELQCPACTSKAMLLEQVKTLTTAQRMNQQAWNAAQDLWEERDRGERL